MSDPRGVPTRKWSWEASLLERGVREGLTPTAQHVALVMSTYANGDGEGIRPTVETLVRASGRSRATVHSALRQLRVSGWLDQVSRGSGAARRASEYRLTVPPKVQEQVLHQTSNYRTQINVTDDTKSKVEGES
jgi:hypothetical protein